MKAKKITRENPIGRFFPEIDSVSHSPRFQVIVTNGVFELLVNTLVQHKCKNVRAKNFNYGNKLVLLNEAGFISDRQFKLLDAFRDLRNEAAHGSFELTEEMLAPFQHISFLTKMKKPNDPLNFQKLCNVLVCGFWNDNIGVFGSTFDNIPQTAYIHTWKKNLPN